MLIFNSFLGGLKWKEHEIKINEGQSYTDGPCSDRKRYQIFNTHIF